MNASKLLKAVLRPRSLQTNVGRNATVSDGPSSRRSLSPDSRLPASTLGSRKSSSPVKMTCMCSPTTHPGSFRCRYHRARQQAGVVALSRPPSRRVEMTDTDILSEVNRTLPGQTNPISRSTPLRCSRLRNMTLGRKLEEDEEAESYAPPIQRECLRGSESPVNNERSISSPGSYHSAPNPRIHLPREIPTVFCQSSSKKALDIFDRSMTRMYL